MLHTHQRRELDLWHARIIGAWKRLPPACTKRAARAPHRAIMICTLPLTSCGFCLAHHYLDLRRRGDEYRPGPSICIPHTDHKHSRTLQTKINKQFKRVQQTQITFTTGASSRPPADASGGHRCSKCACGSDDATSSQIPVWVRKGMRSMGRRDRIECTHTSRTGQGRRVTVRAGMPVPFSHATAKAHAPIYAASQRRERHQSDRG